jgi:hypothetical protein
MKHFLREQTLAQFEHPWFWPCAFMLFLGVFLLMVAIVAKKSRRPYFEHMSQAPLDLDSPTLTSTSPISSQQKEHP